MAVCCLVTFAVLLVSSVVARQHRVDAAADLGALAGADALLGGEDACSRAADIAHANGSVLSNCAVRGDEVLVTMRMELDLPFGWLGHVESQARAGPAD